MNKLFWVVCGDAAIDSLGGFSNNWGNKYGDGDGDGYGDGNGDGDGGGFGFGFGDGLGDGNGYGNGNGALMPALAVPRTLEAHAVVAAVLGRLP